MLTALWGPSDHVETTEVELLASRLRALGLDVRECARDARPDPETIVVIVNSKVQVDASVLDELKELQLVVTTTSGYDHIDLDAARERKVRVARCPRARRDAVVDATLAMSLALLRRLPLTTRAAQAGQWIRAEMKQIPVPRLRGLRVAIFGLGVIGAHAAEVWSSLGAVPLGVDPAVDGLLEKDDVLTRSDIITLHCSLSPTSRHLLDAAALARVKPGAIVVNTARGDCVDLDALCAATQLGGIGLDVFEDEPPKNLQVLAELPNVVLSPHSAGYHAGLGHALNDEIEEQVNAWLKGLPLHGEVRAGALASR